jgi:hypothetical protein
MRLFEQVKLSGFRQARKVPRSGAVGVVVEIHEANGELVVELDESLLRDLSHRAILSRGHKSKSGPVHVTFRGVVSVRDPREGEVLQLPMTFMGAFCDDVFAGHVWTSRPR